MTTDPTCKDRVRERLAGRYKDLAKLWKAYCKGEENVPDLGNLFEYGLAFDYVAPGTFTEAQKIGYFRYQLSWGGPSDEFRFYVGPEFNPYRIEYWFLDWFDGAHIVLRGKKRELLLELWEWFKEGGTVQAEFDKATQ